MSLTNDPNDPRLGHGSDDTPAPQNETYLVLSPEERAKGFLRPLRRSYIHNGRDLTPNPLRDLTPDEQDRYPLATYGYLKAEVLGTYPCDDPACEATEHERLRFWTQKDFNSLTGCGATTTMGLELCETYARDPKFYGATYCVGCSMHRPVAEFVWAEDGQRVGS